jgi:hypothetical protein
VGVRDNRFSSEYSNPVLPKYETEVPTRPRGSVLSTSSAKLIGLFTQSNNQTHNYKSHNNLQIKTKLGNTVCFVTVTWCLADRLRAISFYSPSRHLACNTRQHGEPRRPVSPGRRKPVLFPSVSPLSPQPPRYKLNRFRFHR